MKRLKIEYIDGKEEEIEIVFYFIRDDILRVNDYEGLNGWNKLSVNYSIRKFINGMELLKNPIAIPLCNIRKFYEVEGE